MQSIEILGAVPTQTVIDKLHDSILINRKFGFGDFSRDDVNKLRQMADIIETRLKELNTNMGITYNRKIKPNEMEFRDEYETR